MRFIPFSMAGALAGTINGLLGAGGGMVLVPILSNCGELEETEVFPFSVAVIMPLCIVSLGVSAMQCELPWRDALPYLLGSLPGGLLAGAIGKRIPVKWLHRLLGIMLLWGGFRYLC